jgi:hypothetical protein
VAISINAVVAAAKAMATMMVMDRHDRTAG